MKHDELLEFSRQSEDSAMRFCKEMGIRYAILKQIPLLDLAEFANPMAVESTTSLEAESSAANVSFGVFSSVLVMVFLIQHQLPSRSSAGRRYFNFAKLFGRYQTERVSIRT